MLESKLRQSGISLTTPPNLAAQLLSLPPILHNLSPNPMSSYSKAPRGLFVLLRVRSIFTPISVSPGPSLRQCPIHYAFRAGRNLPDKEFRYLRTVIVTAAVHRGFNSEREPLLLTFRHWAGVSPYTSACAFAQTCVFGKQSVEPLYCGLVSQAPLLPKLRGHFAEFLSARSPVRLRILYASTCVGLWYGRLILPNSDFSWPGVPLTSGLAARHRGH